MQVIILCKYSFGGNGDGNLFNSCLCKNSTLQDFINRTRKREIHVEMLHLIYGERAGCAF